MEENKPQSKFTVVVLKAPDPQALAQFLSTKLNRNFDEMKKLVSFPGATIVSDMDPIWAEDLVQTIKSMGANAEKRLIPSSMPCSFHPAAKGKTVCKICSKVICAECVKEAKGQAICPDCTGESKRIKVGFPWARLISFIVLLSVAGFAYYTITKERAQFGWDRPYKLAVVGVLVDAPPEHKAFLDKFFLDSGGGYADLKMHSLPDAAGWFQREFERYGLSGQALEITTFGPFENMEPPPNPPDPSAGLVTKIFDYRKFKSFWRTFNQKNEFDASQFDGVIYVLVVPGSFDGFVESWASRRDNIGLVHVFPDQNLVDMDIMIVLHEFLHLVNAKDHYDANMNPTFPDGFISPFDENRYPQTYADVMAGRIPISEGDARDLRALKDLRIGIYTAHEIGWLSDEELQSDIDKKETPSFD